MTQYDVGNTESVCFVCGGHMKPVVAPVSIRFREQDVSVPDIPHVRCESCGEQLFTIEQSDRLQRAAADILRSSQGLLSGAEINKWRVASGITQEELESALGVGAKTVTRWERGLVFQSATADRLLRLSIRFPVIYDVLRSGELYDQEAGAASLYADRLIPQRRIPVRAFYVNEYTPEKTDRPTIESGEGSRDAIAIAA